MVIIINKDSNMNRKLGLLIVIQAIGSLHNLSDKYRYMHHFFNS